MQRLKNTIKRNAPVFYLGLIITLVFLLLILSQPGQESTIPAGFIRVEEEIFEPGEPKDPNQTPSQPVEYASQIASPDNKGKPYFYGEHDPKLRDAEGYPVPPSPKTAEMPPALSDEDRLSVEQIIQESYTKRITPVTIKYTVQGFEPTDTVAYTGQKVIWQNTTAKSITITQTLSVHEALKKGLILKPGESVTFRPLINGTFTYLEEASEKYGSITVIDTTAPLQ